MNRYKQHRLRNLDRTLLTLCCVVLGATIVYPTLRLLIEALRSWQWDLITEGAGRQAIVNTLLMCLASVITSGIVGSAIAFFVTRFSFPGRNALAALAYLPFALPPLVGTLSFYYLIGTDGLFPRIIHQLAADDSFIISGPFAILLIHTYSYSFQYVDTRCL